VTQSTYLEHGHPKRKDIRRLRLGTALQQLRRAPADGAHECLAGRLERQDVFDDDTVSQVTEEGGRRAVDEDVVLGRRED